MLNPVTFDVPATTSNLGPGFDCLGVALKLHNRVTVRGTTDQEAKRPGEMAERAAQQFFAASAAAAFPFSWEIAGDVPQSRGLGSSVTVRLGLLHGLNALAGRPLDGERLFEICAKLEGHPDNAAPAAFGGFTVAGGGRPARFEVGPELKFVLLIPDFEISTPKAREALPPKLDRLSAVASCGNACRITAAFAARDYEALKGTFTDGLHQPFRQHLIPFLPEVIAAGEAAGALGGFLSGSGSTICCLTLRDAPDVARAMARAAGQGRTVVVEADNFGVSAADDRK
ncbi:MAG TPA: homoserine kinase [Chthoniobacteraceae bacterium]|jgi:homoserine kinase